MVPMSEELRSALEAARSEGLERIGSADNLADLEEARVRTLGRKAPLAKARSGLGRLDDDGRREVGRLANEVQAALEAALEDRRVAFEAEELKRRWELERVDVTLPGTTFSAAPPHPLTRTITEIVDIFIGLGYRVADGPEAELS